MFNKVILCGNLTRDIELRYLQNGTAIGKSAIAVTKKFTNTNGEKAEKTCFVDITFWGRTAEVANQYLRKGSKVLIEGSLELEQWQDQQTGQNRQKHSIQVESMEMLGDNSQNQQNGYNQGNYQNQNNMQIRYSNNNRVAQAQQTPQNAPQAQNDKYEQTGETIPF